MEISSLTLLNYGAIFLPYPVYAATVHASFLPDITDGSVRVPNQCINYNPFALGNFLWCKLLSSSSHATINSPRSDTPPCPQRRIVKIGLLSIHGVICDCFEHLVCQAVSIRSCFNLLNCFNPASIDSKTYSRVKCRLCIVDCIAHFCCWHMYQVSFILM